MASRFPQKPACPGARPFPWSRRDLLRASANGFGWLALCGMLAEESSRAAEEPLPQPHFRPRARNVIFCFMDGGVSHVDSFDPKPKLTEFDGRPFLDSQNPTARGNRLWLGSPWRFRRHGQSGLPVSELFPHIARCADDLAVIRSMKADLPLHSTGVLRLHTGVNNAGRPSLGSWVTYGLGSENRNLPGFVVLSFGVVPCGGLESFSSGFLPANHQATLFHAEGVPIDNIRPGDRDPRLQRAKLAILRSQDADFARSVGGEGAVSAAIRNYELAYRMQSLVPDVLDLSRETRATQRLYGIDFEHCIQEALRHSVPACPPPDRSRRPLRRDHLPAGALQRHLGPAWRSEARPRKERFGYRPGGRRTHHRPETARASERNTDHLGG
jgi:hypothetical protein